MKKVLSALAFTLAGFPAQSTLVSTGLFSIDIPDGWRIENNRTNIVLAAGNRMIEGMPFPSLTVQYCANKGASSKPTAVTPCEATCDRQAAAVATELARLPPGGNASTGPMARSTWADGTTEFVIEIAERDTVSGFAALLCNQQGWVYLGLLSDSPKSAVKAQFSAILRTLRWN